MEEIQKLTDIEKLENENHRLKKELDRYRRYEMADMSVLSWLAENIDLYKGESNAPASIDEVQDMLRNQIAVSYLLIWPIFERKHFGGSMEVGKIETASEQLKEYYNKDLRDTLDPIAERFFYRYNISNGNQNPKYNSLQPNPNRRKTFFANICRKKYFVQLLPKEKITLLLYVIYRYRNNIFHGYKNIEKWSRYTEQINDCLTGMMILSDCMKKYNITIN